MSLATEPGRACYVPLRHRAPAEEGGGDLFGSDALAEGQMDAGEALALLRPLLEDASVLKVFQNAKYDVKILAREGIEVAPLADTMLMSYALNAGLHAHGMDELSERYLGHRPQPIKALIGSGKAMITFDRVAIEKAVPYAAEDADVTIRLHRAFAPQLHAGRVTTVYETLERPLVPVLARMEMAGIRVDASVLSRMSGAFAQKMGELEADIHALAGRPFNVGSPKQLGEILFDEMALPGGKKGKTGAYSTPADVLEDLATEHDIARRVLDWRQLSKLKSTYTDNLQAAVNPETGRVHTSYSIAGANTGRLASSDPNLQNIPVRTEEGRRIREAFVAPEGRVLVSLDYSQIELRLLTEFADIPAMEEAFASGVDIHAATASEMFGVPLDEMTPGVRRQAKAINFGVIYGISGFGLARNLRIPRDEAQGFIDRYFERFPGIRDYMADTTAFAKAHGHVLTLFGRKIHTPEISASGPRAGLRPPRGDQRPDPGHRRRRDPPRDGAHGAGDRGAGRADAAAGARRAAVRGRGGRCRGAHDPRPRGDGGRGDAGGEAVGAAGGGRGAGGELGGGALTRRAGRWCRPARRCGGAGAGMRRAMSPGGMGRRTDGGRALDDRPCGPVGTGGRGRAKDEWRGTGSGDAPDRHPMGRWDIGRMWAATGGSRRDRRPRRHRGGRRARSRCDPSLPSRGPAC